MKYRTDPDRAVLQPLKCILKKKIDAVLTLVFLNGFLHVWIRIQSSQWIHESKNDKNRKKLRNFIF